MFLERTNPGQIEKVPAFTLKHSARSLSDCKAIASALTFLLFLGVSSLQAQESPGGQQLPSLNWKQGPTQGDLGPQAHIQVPAGYRYVNGEDARQLMQLYGNQPTEMETGYIEPAQNARWFLIFELKTLPLMITESACSSTAWISSGKIP